MKKLILILAIFISVNGFSQTKDSVVTDTLVILNKTDLKEYESYIRQLDEKPSTINFILQFLYQRARIVNTAKKGEAKK